MQVQPYLSFNGRCEEAVEFYRKAVGAEVQMMMRVKDSPEPPAMGSLPPGNENLILHTSFRIGDSVIMASDCGPKGETEYKGFSLTLTVPTDDDAVRTFNGLADGGQVLGPLTKTFFSSKWGVLKDKFGISWMVMVAQQTRPAGA